jgi:hypothetical protein
VNISYENFETTVVIVKLPGKMQFRNDHHLQYRFGVTGASKPKKPISILMVISKDERAAVTRGTYHLIAGGAKSGSY